MKVLASTDSLVLYSISILFLSVFVFANEQPPAAAIPNASADEPPVATTTPESKREKPKTERQLVAHIFEDYNAHIRPVQNYHSVLNVTIQPQIYSLISVDELHEQIKLLIWFPQSWMDEFLTWNPEEWNNITRINLPIQQIWLPDGYIFNTVEMQEPIAQHNARIRYDGYVEVDFNKLIEATCVMTVLNFPFDVQLCELQFGSWSYQIHQIRFHAKETFVPKNAKNSEWDLIAFDAESLHQKYADTQGNMNEYQEIFYRLKIKRKPLYYVVVIIIPTFLIVTVSNIGLFTPHGVQGDREEKVSLGLTTMLTMAVILDMVTGEMPKSSEGIPLLGRYVLVEFMLSIVAVLVSVVIIFLHERVNYMSSTPPKRLVKFLNAEELVLELQDQLSPCKVSETVEELRYGIGLIRNYIEEQESAQRLTILWQRVFSWADLISMVFFTIVNFIITYVMFYEFMD